MSSVEGQRTLIREMAPDAPADGSWPTAGQSQDGGPNRAFSLLRRAVESDWYPALADRLGAEGAWTTTWVSIDSLLHRGASVTAEELRAELEVQIRVSLEAKRRGIVRIDRETNEELRRGFRDPSA